PKARGLRNSWGDSPEPAASGGLGWGVGFAEAFRFPLSRCLQEGAPLQGPCSVLGTSPASSGSPACGAPVQPLFARLGPFDRGGRAERHVLLDDMVDHEMLLYQLWHLF